MRNHHRILQYISVVMHITSKKRKRYFCRMFNISIQILHLTACNAEDPNLIPGSESSSGEGICYHLQHPWASLVAQQEATCSMRDLGLVPGLKKSPGDGKGYPL